MEYIYLYDKIVGTKRIAVKTDPYNWIVLFGSAISSNRNFQKKADHWYFSNIESMLVCVHKKLLRFKLQSLEIHDLKQTLEDAFLLVESMAKEISKKGDADSVQIGILEMFSFFSEVKLDSDIKQSETTLFKGQNNE